MMSLLNHKVLTNENINEIKLIRAEMELKSSAIVSEISTIASETLSISKQLKKLHNTTISLQNRLNTLKTLRKRLMLSIEGERI